jgi:hypothetical protein
MAQQTSVEWLKEKWRERNGNLLIEDFEQAQEMQKEQIMDALVDGRAQYRDKQIIPAEQYYNEKYGTTNGSSETNSGTKEFQKFPNG